MKKALSILTALLMLLSAAVLSGCNGEESPVSPPESVAPVSDSMDNNAEKEETPDAGIQARLDAGEEVLIGLCFTGLDNQQMAQQHDFLMQSFTELGFACSSAISNSNVVLMIEQVENFITMEAALIIINPPDTDSVKEVLLKAIDAGTYVVFMAMNRPEDYEVSGGSAVNWDLLGEVFCEMVGFWTDKAYPDAAENPIKVAFSSFSMVEFYKGMCDGIAASVTADPRYDLVYTKDLSVGPDGGFTFAEEALTVDRDIKLLLAWQNSVAVGVNNYVMANPEYDPAAMAVFATGAASESREIIEASANNESIYRGTVAYGYEKGNYNSAEGLLHVALTLLFEEAEPPYWNDDEIWTEDAIDFGLVV